MRAQQQTLGLALAVAVMCMLCFQTQVHAAKAKSSKLCGSTSLRIGDKVIRSFDDLSKFFSYYSLIPRIDNREMVAISVVVPKPCGPFTANMTLYMRASTKDVRSFADVFQFGALKAVTSTFNKTKPATILELGAHSGMTTVYLANKYPQAQLAAVEPDASAFALLRLNTAHLKQVKNLEYGAAWDRATTVKFGRDMHGRSLWQRFVVDVVDLTTGRIGEVVPGLHVGDLIDKYGWDSVDLLVSDMEGAERVVIADASAKDWLPKVKCLALKPYDRVASSLTKMFASMASPRFVKKAAKNGMITWCQAGAGEV